MLWRKVRPGLSAGRVQSVATRLVVERERERMAFRSAAYWDVEGTFDQPWRASRPVRRPAGGGRRHRVATGRDFADDGQPVARSTACSSTRPAAVALADGLRESPTSPSASVEEKPYTRRPAAPFTTSTLQQEASRKLRLSAADAMRVAQRLYENGYITYMRTDSTTLSERRSTPPGAQAARALRRRVRARRAAPLRAQGQERAGGARGDPPVRRRVPHARRRWPASCAATSSRSTS